MLALSYEHGFCVPLFLDELAAFVVAASAVDERSLLAPSRCHGWAVVDVVVHVRAGLDEMLAGVATTTDSQADRDAASYWAAPAPQDVADDDIDAILWTRRTASAYRRPARAVAHLAAVADRVRPAVSRMPAGNVAFQGHVLRSADFLATWATELAIHHLDLTRELDLPGPTPAALRVSRDTLEALAAGSFPPAMDDTAAVLIGSGRRPPTEAELQTLGTLAKALPVLA